ncbi:MAG: SCP2 sterol-binding domain-containing protein [Thermodesulfobacteriota bacterium]
MTEPVVYLSPGWRDEAERRLKAELTADKMKNITTSMSNLYKNCPGGVDKYLFVKFVDGGLADVRVGEGDPPEAEFKITGDYEVFARITQGQIKSQRALMSGKLKLRGNMVKALKLASLADRMNKVLAAIPAQY